MAQLQSTLLQHLIDAKDTKSQEVLASLGFKEWEAVDTEAAEFMVDLMDTLV